MCGRIIGYQFGRPNAFFRFNNENGVSIEKNFLDGIVLARSVIESIGV